MGFIDLFPTVILQETLTNLSKETLIKYKNIIQSENLVKDGNNGGYTSNQKLLEISSFSYLKTQILELSKRYLTEIGHKFQDVQISSSWGNVLQGGNQIYNHEHANAYICGAFYLDNSSPISFQNPHLYNWKFIPESDTNSNKLRKQQEFSLSPIKNSIILFPSWLKHRVLTTTQEQRISIAFNIIPKGEFGIDTQKLYL